MTLGTGIEGGRVLIADVDRQVLKLSAIANALQHVGEGGQRDVFSWHADEHSNRHRLALAGTPHHARGIAPVALLRSERLHSGAGFRADRRVIGEAARDSRPGEI